MRRGASGGRVLYSVYAATLGFGAAGGHHLVLRERLALDDPNGSAPVYDHRSALLTLR
jgi:hypothetical protein